MKDKLKAVGRPARDHLIRLTGRFHGRTPTYWFRGTPNLGDQLSPQILAWATGLNPIWVSRSYTGKVLGTGSILRALAQRDIVWGAGLIADETLEPPSDVTFLAVRGPLTRDRILDDVPQIYGDPALLLPRFFNEPIAKRYEIGVVPHYMDHDLISTDDPSVHMIDVRGPWPQVVNEIRTCARVLSSSLHGLIVAEAYGIPASWIRISDRIIGGEFKFNDYYLSTGRPSTRPTLWVSGIRAALDRTQPAPVFDPEPLVKAAMSIRDLRKAP